MRSTTGGYGTLEGRYEYDAFGNPYLGDLESGMDLGYTGKPYDTTTGLYNYGYRDYSPSVARFTTVDPVRDGTNWFAYVNNDPVNYVDLWGLWDFHGDGTATAEPGDTLWGLANQVSNDGTNWTKTDYTGNPQQLQIGQVVDYRGMTTVVQTNAYIVASSVFSSNSALVDAHFSSATKILNSQGVPITFSVTKQTVESYTTGGVNLRDVTIGDKSYNMALGQRMGNAITTTGGEISLLDYSGNTFNYLFNNSINSGSVLGVNFGGTTTVIISSMADGSTAGHETGHILRRDEWHSSNQNALMFGYKTNGSNTYIPPEEAAKMRDYFSGYPHAYTGGGQGTSQKGH